MNLPCRGEVWLVDLNPTRGHEQNGKRPALIVSNDLFNHGPADLVVVVPLTTAFKNIPLHVEIKPTKHGLNAVGYAKCEDVRSISAERLIKRLGIVNGSVLLQVEDKLRILLEL